MSCSRRMSDCLRPAALLAGLVLVLAGCAPLETPRRQGEERTELAAPRDLASPAPSAGRVSPGAPEAIRVALLLPLSGPAGGVGNALRDAAALALFDAYDPRLELLPFDTIGTPEGARRAAERAVAAQVQIALGPLLAESIAAAAPVLREAGIELIGFSNNRRVATPGVWLTGFMPDQEVEHIIRHAAREGHRKFAALVPLSPYGDRVLQSFGPAVLDAGGEIAALGRYEADPDRLVEPVRRIARYEERHAAHEAEVRFLRELNDDMARELLRDLANSETIGGTGYDTILIAEGDPLLRTLGPLLPYFEVDPAEVQFLGTGLWDDPALLREPPLRGARFPAPEPTRPRAFLERLARQFGGEPPRIATLAYDAMALVATLARNPLVEDRFSHAALADPAGFFGLDGAFRFGPDGIAERRLAILEIGREGFGIVEPAVRGFEAPGVAAFSAAPTGPAESR